MHVPATHSASINNYTNFCENIDDVAFLHKNTKFSKDFDKLLNGCVVPESENELPAVRIEILRAIEFFMSNGNTEGVFIICAGSYTFPMWIRVSTTDDSVLVEFEEN